MTLLSTSPQTHTVLRTEQLRPAAINVALIKQDDSPVDLTGCTLRVTIAQLPYRGGAVLHTQLATAVDLALGLMRFDIQGDDLEFVAGTYPFAMTLVTAEGFQTTIVKGEIDHQANPDAAVPLDYTTVAPPLGLTVALLDNNRITVKVNHHPDSVLMAFAQAADDAYQGAQVASQSAAASAVSAAASAEAAEAIVIADFTTVLEATFPDRLGAGTPIRLSLDPLFADQATETTVNTGRLSQASLDAAYADQATEDTVSTGRLSLANLVASARGIDSFTTAARDALAGAALWDGRVIYNTTTDRLNRYDTGTTTWYPMVDSRDLATATPATSPTVAGAVGVATTVARSDHVHPAPAYADYVPALTNFAATVNWARYIRIGNLVTVQIKLTITSVPTGGIQIALPVAARAGHPAVQSGPVGTAFAHDVGATAVPGIVVLQDTTKATIASASANNQWWANGSPFGWAVGDEVGMNFSYEAA